MTRPPGYVAACGGAAAHLDTRVLPELICWLAIVASRLDVSSLWETWRLCETFCSLDEMCCLVEENSWLADEICWLDCDTCSLVEDDICWLVDDVCETLSLVDDIFWLMEDICWLTEDDSWLERDTCCCCSFEASLSETLRSCPRWCSIEATWLSRPCCSIICCSVIC